MCSKTLLSSFLGLSVAAAPATLKLTGAASKIIFDSGEPETLTVTRAWLEALVADVASCKADVAALQARKPYFTAAADPETCSAAITGKIYFNTDLKLLKVCDGAAWTEIAARKPGTESHPGKDCLDLKESGIDLDGTYFVDFGTSDVFEVYCDQTNDGGGWTKFMSAEYPFFFDATSWQSLNENTPVDVNYSILRQRGALATGGSYTARLTIGYENSWNTGPIVYNTKWQQSWDMFSQSTDGAGYAHIGGPAPTTCGGFNGLHNKYTARSYTCDPDINDNVGCWYMQVVPNSDYCGTRGSVSGWANTPGKGYLDGYAGGIDHCHKWQVLWFR